MTITFRPARRENTPLIIGLAGATKSGKTYSALRLATGLSGGAPVVMINSEGARGHLYADTFKYLAYDVTAPFRPDKFTEALAATRTVKPGAIIVDSGSAFHDGPGGILEWHEEILDERAGSDQKRRERLTWSAWIGPKAAENAFIYQMLLMDVPVVLCLRAKEKAFIQKGADPVFRWSPIVGDRVAFETIFTLMFLPGANGVPTLELSDLRTPFDKLIPQKRQIDESLGQQLAAWAKGGPTAGARPPASESPSPSPGLAVAQPGASSGSGSAGTPSPTEIMAHDFAERWDEVRTGAQGQAVMDLWNAAKTAHPFTPAELQHVEHAIERARERTKRR